MKYLVLFLVALAAAAPAKGAEPCLQIKEISAITVHRNGFSWETTLKLISRCPVNIQSRDLEIPIELQNAPGLKAHVFVQGQFKPGHKISIPLTLEASADAPLGKMRLQGLLPYRAMKSGQWSDEVLSLELPVKVLRPEPLDTFAHDHPIWSKILIPFEVAVAIPWCFILFISGHGVYLRPWRLSRLKTGASPPPSCSFVSFVVELLFSLSAKSAVSSSFLITRSRAITAITRSTPIAPIRVNSRLSPSAALVLC